MLIGNKVTEKDIRDWLDANGFVGRTAKINDLELHAIRRPGWLQIFRFELDVLRAEQPDAASQQRHKYFGVVRDDERERVASKRTIVMLFDEEQGRQEKLDELSEGLIQLGQDNSGSLLWLLIIMSSIFALGMLASQFITS